MFGYVTVDPGELKGKDLDRYHMYYCGVCRDLKARCGEKARMTLTYDMTFLAILLTSLYEGETKEETCRCALHPLRERKIIRNEYTAYAADMNLILMYHNLMDDWIDDRNAASRAGAGLLRSAYLKTAAKYPRQIRAVRHYLKALHETERNRSGGIDQASGLTGELFREIYQYRDDFWKEDLGELGFYIGKFIYLMDAWDDLEKDRKTGDYNPFLSMADEPDFDRKSGNILTMQAAGATRAFERLPVLLDVDILRNILYCGIWVRYRMKKTKAEKDGSISDAGPV